MIDKILVTSDPRNSAMCCKTKNYFCISTPPIKRSSYWKDHPINRGQKQAKQNSINFRQRLNFTFSKEVVSDLLSVVDLFYLKFIFFESMTPRLKAWSNAFLVHIELLQQWTCSNKITSTRASNYCEEITRLKFSNVFWTV